MALIDVHDPTPITYTLTGSPADLAGTTVTALVIDPSSAATSTGLAHTAGTADWIAVLNATRPGSWQVQFTATGAIQDTETVTVVVVDPTLGQGLTMPGWAPTIEDVAVHIPTRTRAVGVDDTYLLTFTADTTPTQAEAARLIGHACAWVAASVGYPVAAEAAPAAAVAASLWAAYWIELAYPERDGDVQIYDRLRIDGETAITRAGELNAAAGGATSLDTTPEDSAVTLYGFPDPVSYGDVQYL